MNPKVLGFLGFRRFIRFIGFRVYKVYRVYKGIGFIRVYIGFRFRVYMGL